MDPRIILRIELTPGAKVRLNEFCDKAGMTQVATLSRLVEWFANQPDAVQRLIVGHVPREIQQDVARLMLKNLAKQ
ncbi:MAG TPA: hypothetical protein VGP99_11750 [Tepidisphaeraceae bacterium]|nr:hypothetical protein [Tepidisphaeraceae bacterium]